MKKIFSLLILFATITISSCTTEVDFVLASFDVYCEMVANDAKPIALHYPMDSAEVDALWKDFEKISKKYDVKLYKENEFPTTLLFPSELTKGKSIVLIYNGDRLLQYQQLKEDLKAYQENNPKKLEEFARRFGRLLGYTPKGINKLLSKNTDYNSFASFNVTQQVTHLYYKDVNAAIKFYENTLGLNKIDSNTIQISNDAFIRINPLNEEHPEGQTKSTAIALLTNQLPEWYTYIEEQNVPIKYTYKPKGGGPHDGFVAIDPEGYLLEFEQFKQHPENELFMAALSKAKKVETKVNQMNFYGSITWTYHNDLLLMQKFYEEVLGYQLVADQGWTKIYQTSPTGFIGLVDERRGMEDYAETKGVELEWIVEKKTEFNAYANAFWKDYNYNNSTFIGPEKYIYHINGQ